MNRLKCSWITKRRRGGTIVLLICLLPILFLISAMAINIAYMERTRLEAQIAVDAATRAAAFELSRSGDQAQVIATAQSVAARNLVAGQPLPLSGSDFVFGMAQRPSPTARYSFVAGSANPNAVWLQSQSLANLANGPIQPLFPIPTPVSFKPLRQAISTQMEADIAIVLDRSGSMAFSSSEAASTLVPPAAAPPGWVFGMPVPPQARWLDLLAALQAFTDVLAASPTSEHVSLTTYNHGTKLECELTDNYSLFPTLLAPYSLSFNAGGTAIGNGVYSGIGSLQNAATQRPSAYRLVIVMTDGMQNYGANPYDAAYACVDNQTTMISVTFSAEADQTTMQEASAITGGYNIHAVDRDQLIAAFTDIARSLPSLMIQ